MDKVEEFLKEKSRTRSEKTMSSQRYILNRFDKEVGLDTATSSDIYDWLEMKMEKDDMKKTSSNQYIAVLKNFYRWCKNELPTPSSQEEFVEIKDKMKRYDKILSMDRWRTSSKEGDPVPKDVFLNLLNVANPTDTYLFYILWYFGFRKEELYGLEDRDVDLENNSLYIREEITKSQKPRTVYYTDTVEKMLREMINSTEKKHVIGMDAYDYFLNRRLNNYEDELEEHVWPHRARHTFNHEMKQILGDNILVKRILGHKIEKTDMTARYSKSIESVMRNAMTSDHYYDKWGIMDGIEEFLD